MIVTRWMGFAVLTAVCGMGCAASASDRCASDTDCKGSRVCSDGVCVDGAEAGPGNGTDGDGGSGGDAGNGNGNNGACDPVGTSCTATTNCCQSGSGIGVSGAICISNDNLCHAACASDAECQSGCCAPVEGQALGVCAVASACAPTCTQPGGACATPSDCCQSGTNIPYGATCLSSDYTCHDVCYASSECTSGCCIALQGLSYGACGSAAGHACL